MPQKDVNTAPEEEILLTVHSLNEQITQLVTDWHSTEEQMRKAGEADSTQHDQLKRSQKDFDNEISGSSNAIRNNISAKQLQWVQSIEAAEVKKAAAREEVKLRHFTFYMPFPHGRDQTSSGASSLAGAQILRLNKMEPPKISGEL